MKTLTRTCLGRALLALSLSVAGLAACAAAPPPQTALPGDSIYQIKARLHDQDARPFKLAERRGQPVLVSMFYNSCKFVCPMLIDSMRLTGLELSAQERARLSMLLITFDPARDDVKGLKTVSVQRELDPAHWTLARTDAASVRKIAASLDIQYRLLSDGEYNHTTVLVLLDADGRIVGRTRKLGSADPEFVKLIRQTLQGSGT
ncbi:MAG: SCO family protein [Telluria sp.]|nr:SCO family protein [Telluria sp.]